MRCCYILLLLTCILIEASDLKKIEDKIGRLNDQIVREEKLVDEVKECRNDANSDLERTMYMKEFSSRQRTVLELQADLRAMQRRKEELTKAVAAQKKKVAD